MPPGYEPFLAAVCAAPADDLPRLVFADWLDERGDGARAEFIRLQVSAAGLPPGQDPRTERAAELWHAHRAAWKAELPKIDGVNWGEFRRGFVNVVTFQRQLVFFADAGHLLASVAPADTLRLFGLNSRRLPDLLRHPHVNRVRYLRVNPVDDIDEFLTTVAEADGLAGLEELTVTTGVWHPGWPRDMTVNDSPLALARSTKLTRLRRLTLTGARVTEDAYVELQRRFGSHLFISGQ